MTRLSWPAIGASATLIAMLALLCHISNGDYEPIESVASARYSLAPTQVVKPELQPSSVYESLVQRPLMTPTRRPQPTPVQPVPTIEGPKPPQVAEVPTLLGTVIGPDRRAAFVKSNDGPTVTVAEGGAVAGWTLDQVQPGEVVFRMGAEIVPVKVSWRTARQNTAATSLVAETSTMPMRGRGGGLPRN